MTAQRANADLTNYLGTNAMIVVFERADRETGGNADLTHDPAEHAVIGSTAAHADLTGIDADLTNPER